MFTVQCLCIYRKGESKHLVLFVVALFTVQTKNDNLSNLCIILYFYYSKYPKQMPPCTGNML